MRHKWEGSSNLRRLYDERIEPHMNQKEFAKRVGVGQSMVAMILNGERSLPLDLAPAFARELRCTIYDICPEMGDYIKDVLLPVLGKALRRAAMVTVAIVLQQLYPSDATASALHNLDRQDDSFAKSLNILHIGKRLALLFVLFLQRLSATLNLADVAIR